MTEQQLRELFADACAAFLGCNEADGSHRQIIDLYNKISPLPRGYKMTYHDPWCAAFPSAVGESLNLGHIILPECSCDAMINLYKAKGRWREADEYSAKVGDIVMYDWNDDGRGDNIGSADHTGVVYAETATSYRVIEGNMSDSVDFRIIKKNGINIRGFCCPDFASAAGAVDEAPKPEVSQPADVIIVADKETVEVKLPVLRKGDVSAVVGAMQSLIMHHGFSVGVDGADDDFGNNTDIGLRQFQRENGLTKDGVCGVNTWSKLLGL